MVEKMADHLAVQMVASMVVMTVETLADPKVDWTAERLAGWWAGRKVVSLVYLRVGSTVDW